jgi:hypothetical protein
MNDAAACSGAPYFLSTQSTSWPFGKGMEYRMKDPKWIFPVVAAFVVLSSLAHGILGRQ